MKKMTKITVPFKREYDVEAYHAKGAERHGWKWLKANQMAVDSARGCGIDPSHPAIKELLTVAVFKILDALFPK